MISSKSYKTHALRTSVLAAKYAEFNLALYHHDDVDRASSQTHTRPQCDMCDRTDLAGLIIVTMPCCNFEICEQCDSNGWDVAGTYTCMFCNEILREQA